MAGPSEDVPRDGFGEGEVLSIPKEAAGSQTAGDPGRAFELWMARGSWGWLGEDRTGEDLGSKVLKLCIVAKGGAALLGYSWMQKRFWRWVKRSCIWLEVGFVSLLFQSPCQSV